MLNFLGEMGNPVILFVCVFIHVTIVERWDLRKTLKLLCGPDPSPSHSPDFQDLFFGEIFGLFQDSLGLYPLVR